MSDSVSITFTKEEAEAVYGACFFINAHYGEPPNPPTPGMTAQAKLAEALDIPLDTP